MSGYRYTILLERDDDEGGWVSYVPALNWLSDFGDTREDALLRTREAIIGYVKTLKAHGMPVPAGDPPRPWEEPWPEEPDGRPRHDLEPFPTAVAFA